jgi:hypothetical protein
MTGPPPGMIGQYELHVNVKIPPSFAEKRF